MRLKCSVAAVALVLMALPVSAHHSHGNYRDAFSDLTGIVKEVHLVAPHSWVYVEVKDTAGTPRVWALEGSSRSGLEKIGVTRDYLKVGDTIKVRCYALRDGSPGCLLGFIKAADGSVKDWDARNAVIPADF